MLEYIKGIEKNVHFTGTSQKGYEDQHKVVEQEEKCNELHLNRKAMAVSLDSVKVNVLLQRYHC